MQKRRSLNVDMLHGPILKTLIVFTIPIVLSNWLQILFNGADLLVIGRFDSDEALAAVGLTTPIVRMLVGFFTGISVGVNVVVARAVGAGDKKLQHDAVHTAITFSYIIGIVLTICGELLLDVLLDAVNTPADIRQLTRLYLSIYFLGLPPVMVFNYAAAVIRAGGDTRTPMLILTTTGGLNLILDIIAIVVLGSGVGGVAVATIFTYYIAFIWVFIHMCRMDGELRYRFSHSHISGRLLGNMIGMGVPVATQSVMMSLSTLLIHAAVNTFGTAAVAGVSAAETPDAIVWMAMNSISQATVSFIGQNMGAGDYTRVRKITRTCILTSFVTAEVLGLALFFLRYEIIGLFVSDPQAIQSGVWRIAVQFTVYGVAGLMDTVLSVNQGYGYPKTTMIISILGICVFRIIYLNTIFQWYHTQFVLFLSFPMGQALTAAGQLVCHYITGKMLPENRTVNVKTA